jgi:hypothetical protein
MSNYFLHHNLDSEEDVLGWKSFLACYSLESIHQQFENYKSLCHLGCVNSDRIESCVNSLFEINVNGYGFSPNFKYSVEPENRPSTFPYYFFRVRHLTKVSWIDVGKNGVDLKNMEFEEIQTLQDIWERSAEQVSDYQRLNCPHHSVLYTSLMPSTTVLETNLKEQDLFVLIVYKSPGHFTYSDCLNFVYFDGLTEEENMKRYIMFNFLRNEFIRILPGSYEAGNQYCASYFISKKFFVSESSQAIQYPSAQGLGHKNFAFWGNIRDCLDFVGFRFCTLAEKKRTQSNLSVLADGFWNYDLAKFEYFSPYSEESQRIFGDMLLSAMLRK